jgi:glycosyltransferase involved in cell wall biosynthesis
MINKLRILFIAPIPPPVDGQSKASKILLEKLLSDDQNVVIVDLAKNSLQKKIFDLNRIIEIIQVLFLVWKNRKNKDIIYLSLAESFFGNIRDLFIYTICYNSRNKIFIHMLGGAGMKKILEGKGFQKKINSFFINEIAGVIVEGSVNFEVFSKVICKKKIHIIPNFAEDFLFVNDEEIKAKFSDKQSIQILYLSNLIPGKGYNELADAYIGLSKEIQNQFKIIFVGGFENKESEFDFLSKIDKVNGIKYLGKFIDGIEKRELYCKSHIFCLPTYYPFEGQPISILEAYATGCVVVTSNHSGIPFIFKDKINGYMVEKGSVESLKSAFEIILANQNNLELISFNNRNEAVEKYRTEIYQNAFSKIFKNIKK